MKRYFKTAAKIALIAYLFIIFYTLGTPEKEGVNDYLRLLIEDIILAPIALLIINAVTKAIHKIKKNP